jgi:hypothetical protein
VGGKAGKEQRNNFLFPLVGEFHLVENL